MSSAGLNVINKLPTRFGPHSKPSLLDLFCVSDVNSVLHFEQLSLSGVSDHDLIFLSYNLVLRPIINSSPEYLYTRNFNEINVEDLANEASALPWNDCWFLPILTKKLNIFPI